MAPQRISVRPEARSRFAERLDGVNAGGVDGGHVAQAQNHDGVERLGVQRCLDSFSVVPNRNGPWMRSSVT